MTKDGYSHIITCVRKRPINDNELSNNEFDVIKINNKKTISVFKKKKTVDLSPYIERHDYKFDYIFGQNTTNNQIYNSVIKNLLYHVMVGGEALCFAFGQTGSGKTHTIFGNNGIAKLSVNGLLTLIKLNNLNNKYKLWLSASEIYNSNIYDLLNNKNKIFIREDNKSNVNIVGNMMVVINTLEDFNKYFNYIQSHRISAETNINKKSSRSHAIIQLHLSLKNKMIGKFILVDLAGSERLHFNNKRNKILRRQSAEINKSLFTLKECIRSIYLKKKYIPFRSSKLTTVLKKSFTNNCRTVMISTISPGSASISDTLNTMKYTSHVKCIKKIKKTIIENEEIKKVNNKYCLPMSIKHKKAINNKQYIKKRTLFKKVNNNCICNDIAKIFYKKYSTTSKKIAYQEILLFNKIGKGDFRDHKDQFIKIIEKKNVYNKHMLNFLTNNKII